MQVRQLRPWPLGILLAVLNQSNSSMLEQTEVDSLVSIIDELQANYWKGLKKGKIIIVDTSYLLDEDFLPMFSPIVVPFQVMIELGKLRKRNMLIFLYA